MGNEDDVFIIINQKSSNFYQSREMQNILTTHDTGNDYLVVNNLRKPSFTTFKGNVLSSKMW